MGAIRLSDFVPCPLGQKRRVLLLLLLLLLLLQNLYSAQIQASSSQRRWCGKVGNMTSRGVLKCFRHAITVEP